MASERARPRAPPFIDPPGYARHRPEATLLYQLVERHYPEFVEPAVFAAAVLVVGAVGIAAGYLPARRASSVAPMEALRFE